MTACREATGQEIVPSPVTNGKPSATMTRRVARLSTSAIRGAGHYAGRAMRWSKRTPRLLSALVLMTAVVVAPVATAANAAVRDEHVRAGAPHCVC